MPLTLYCFQQLRPRAQLLHVLLEGTYLTQNRCCTSLVNLYYLPDGGRGFFIETGLDEAQDCFVVLRSFSDSVPLEAYAHGIRLPEV